MFSVDDINEMQKTIERQNRIITVLKRTVKQWVKEYNILDEIIEMYKMSENEANEIIAELKAENKIILDRLTQYEDDADVQVCLFSDVKRLEQENARLKEENEKLNKMTGIFSVRLCEKYHKTLQEIKTIAEENKDTVQYGGICRSILMEITKAEEE